MTGEISYPWPPEFSLHAKNIDDLREGFGERGFNLTRWFKDRTTRHRFHNGLEEEIFVLRRYLFTKANNGFINYPLSLKSNESPDFLCEEAGEKYGIEITEATHTRDQKEMTRLANNPNAQLQGSEGGRFENGAGGEGPERALIADVLRAIRRKTSKVPNFQITSEGHPTKLLLYASSNATNLIYDDETTLMLSHQYVKKYRSRLRVGSNIGEVSVILGRKIAIDIGLRTQILDVSAAWRE